MITNACPTCGRATNDPGPSPSTPAPDALVTEQELADFLSLCDVKDVGKALKVHGDGIAERLAAEVRRLQLVHEQVAYALNISNDGNLPKAALELHTRQTEADMRLHIATCQRDAALEELAAANADRANLREALRQKARAVCDQAAANPAFLGFAAIDALRTELDKP